MQPATLYYKEKEKVCVYWLAKIPDSYLHSPGFKHRPSTFNKRICDFFETGGNGHISLHWVSAWKMVELPDKPVKMEKHLSFRLSTL